jgi:eukaryotic-like serine/threonine-protein kinase
MALPVADFWKLVIESHLLTAEQCQRYAAEFGAVKGANQSSAATLAEWLISQNIISRYQATVLLAGKSGPFAFGDYRVYDRVEKGRLAGVFRAVHAATGHPVMLAFLPSAVTSDAALWNHTVRAAQTLGALHNPHLRRCYDLVDLGKYRFLVQEDVRGATIRESLAPGQVVPPTEVCRILRQAALGAASLHAVQCAHRHLMPNQLWLSDAAQIKVLFDPTRRPGPINFADSSGDVASLVDYLAPELFRPGQTPSPSTDVYALGCTAYEMLAGRPPFPGGSLGEKAARHASEPIAPLEYAGVPPQIAHLVSYMLAKDPAVRFPNAATLVDVLASFVDPAAVAMVPPSLATTAAFERWMVEHQAIRARRASQAAVASEPTVVKPAGPAIQLDLGGSKVAAAGATTAIAASSGSATASYRRRSKNTGLIATGITVAVAAVVGIVVMNAMRGEDSADQSPSSNASVATTSNGGKGVKKSTTPGTENPQQFDANNSPPENKTPGTETPPTPGDPRNPPLANGNNAEASAPVKNEPQETVVADDGKLLWASPTWGPPLDARLVGLGAQAMLVVRPAALAATTQGERFLASLGPGGAALKAAIETASGAAFDKLERVHIVLYANGDAPPTVSYVVHFRNAIAAAELAKNWKGASESLFEGKKLYASDTTAYYVPTWGENRMLATGSVEAIQEIVRQDDKPGSFGPIVDKMLLSTDAERHVTFVGAPQFLFGDGRKLFSGPAERLQEPLDTFVGDGVRAIAVSLHVDDANFFAELRALGALEHKPEELAARFESKLVKLPSAIEDAQVGARFSPYGEKTIRRFPQMLNQAALSIRTGMDDGQAVLRCYLPAVAAPNLAQAIDLAVHETGSGVAAVAVKPKAEDKPKTPTEKLATKVNVSFPKESLEKALEIWSNEVGLKVVMLGPDMMADGITKNQSINEFNEQGAGAEAILLKILKIANPEGKLVYVLKPEKPGGEQVVFITTRTAAKTRGDKLPASLAEAPAAKKKP